MQHAMPAARIACGDPGNLQRHDGRIQQRHHPAHRPHKALRLARAPVHILGPVNRQHFLRQLGRQDLVRRAAQCASPSRPRTRPSASSLFRARQRPRRLLRKGLGGGRRRAVLERHLPRRAGQLLLGVGLLGQHALGQHGQPPRRGVGRHLRASAQAAARASADRSRAAQLGLGPGNHPRRNLFEPDLQ